MLAAAGGAQAQTASSVTLYGHLDTGIEHLTNVQGGGSLTRMPGLTGTAPSRWGLRGSEDLGGGLSAVFALESGFGPDAGTFNQGGRGFGRQAWAGLSGGWGSVSLGRNYTMLYWALFDADLLGPNAFGLSSLDSYIPNTRTDNSLAYRGRFGAWSLGAAYSLGRDAVNAGPSPAGTNCAGESATDRQACRQWSAMLKYDTAPWGFALAVDEMRGGAGAFAGLTRSDLKDRRIMLNGYAALSPTIKLGAGLMRRDNDAAQAASASNGATPRSTLAWGGLSWSPAPPSWSMASCSNCAMPRAATAPLCWPCGPPTSSPSARRSMPRPHALTTDSAWPSRSARPQPAAARWRAHRRPA